MDLKSIIIKALNKTQGQPIEVQADRVMEYIDLLTDGPQEERPVVDTTPPRSNVIVLPTMETPPPRRVLTSRSAGDIEYRTVEEIHEYLVQNAPPSLQIKIQGADKPWDFRRKVEKKDALNLVRLTYLAPSSADGPAAVFSTTDETMDLDTRLREIVEAAQGRYSGQKRKIEARVPPPPSDNLDAILKSSMGQSVDDEADPAYQRAEAALREIQQRGDTKSLWNGVLK